MIKLYTLKTNFKITRIAFMQAYQLHKELNEPAQLPFYELLFVENGQVKIESKTYNGIVSQNQLILIPPNEMHSIKPIGEHKTTIIHAGIECASKYLSYFTTEPTPISLSLQDYLYKALKEVSSITTENNPPRVFIRKKTPMPFCAEQIFRQDLEYFFIMSIRKKTTSINYANTYKRQHYYNNELVPEILEYINKHIYENITIPELCDKFQLNKTTLYKLFKESQGRTIIKYINKSKIQLAKNMIRAGNKNFTEIANDLGFSSIHYFCKVFIKYENMTPTEYSKTITAYIEEK